MTLDGLKKGAVTLVLLSLVIGALVLGLDSFQDQLESNDVCDDVGVNSEATTWNTTAQACVNASEVVTTGPNYQYNVTQEGLEGTANATSYLSTIGTLIGVAALISIVVGAFMFIKR